MIKMHFQGKLKNTTPSLLNVTLTHSIPTYQFLARSSMWPMASCGTSFQLICDKLILTLNSLNGCWRHFCLGIESAAHCG